MSPLDSILRLAVDGTLAPGRPNEHVLADLPGRWIEGTVRGELRLAGWGAEPGFPGIVLGGADASVVEVAVLESEALPAHWGRLDAFERPGHRRTVASVQTATGELDAAIYVLADA